MNILGFNPSHHGSICLLQDGELKYFIQEERLTRKKYDGLPFKSFIDILQNHKIDLITWATPSIEYHASTNIYLPYWLGIAEKYHSNIRGIDFSNEHHKTHCAHSFYNSGYKEAIGVVIDGIGSRIGDYIDHLTEMRETESIYKCSYPSNFKPLYKNITNTQKQVTLSRVYETITMYLGWDRNDAGKTMGLASYGTQNPNISNLFTNHIGNPNIFYVDVLKQHPELPWMKGKGDQETFINLKRNPNLNFPRDPREWHHDKSKITNFEKDLAWRVQQDTQKLIGDYIEKAIQDTDLKQVCCAGGYFLNCVNNYYLTKRFPDIEFYFEPVANDAGTAIGAAKLLYHQQTQDTTIRPFKSLYLGKQYSKEELIGGIKKYT